MRATRISVNCFCNKAVYSRWPGKKISVLPIQHDHMLNKLWTMPNVPAAYFITYSA